MKVQLIKKEIPEEISEQGGCSLQIVNKETVDLETTVDEAKDQLCVIGDRLLVKGEFVGLFKSMIAGIQRDGNARTLGDFLTLYPVPTGEFDLEKGWDPVANGVRIRARLLNEMDIDISKWEFEDVTPGRQPFTIESVQAGPVTGIVQNGHVIEINGRNMPDTAHVSVDWAVPEMSVSGTVAAAKVTSKATRCDIAADGLASILTAAYDGKTLDLTVRGNCANAKISAKIKYVAPPPPQVTSVTQGAYGGKEPPAPGEVAYNQGEVSIKGVSLKLSAGDTVSFEATYQGQPVDTDITDDITTNTDTELKTPRGFSNSSDITDAEWASLNALLVVKKRGVRYTFPVRFADVQTDSE